MVCCSVFGLSRRGPTSVFLLKNRELVYKILVHLFASCVCVMSFFPSFRCHETTAACDCGTPRIFLTCFQILLRKVGNKQSWEDFVTALMVSPTMFKIKKQKRGRVSMATKLRLYLLFSILFLTLFERIL